MRFPAYLLAFSCLALLAGTPALGAEPDRVLLNGFSIAKPAAIWREDDFLFRRTDTSMFVSYATDILKPPSKAFIQLMAQVPAKEEGLPDIPNDEAGVLAWLEARLERDRLRMPKHFQLRSREQQRVRADRGTCIREHTAVDDDDWRGPDGERAVLSSYYLYCPHPDRPSYVITVRYTFWLAPGVSPNPLGDELTPIQNGLRFEPM